ncbi:MAG: GntR family transcriptional regulator [Erysipelothrix sp.]|jgi:DNA-binding transcriptional regulator YhcF (GntR family)|nr:GntR family transcriptional regulator [Erysipelothrix sp.]
MFEKKIPIYIQLIELFQQYIVSGQWPANSVIDSVRNLALQYQVNPNTVLRALSELEAQGLLINDGTLGKRVCDDEALIEALKQAMFDQAKATFFKKANEIGYNEAHVLRLLKGEGEQT